MPRGGEVRIRSSVVVSEGRLDHWAYRNSPRLWRCSSALISKMMRRLIQQSTRGRQRAPQGAAGAHQGQNEAQTRQAQTVQADAFVAVLSRLATGHTGGQPCGRLPEAVGIIAASSRRAMVTSASMLVPVKLPAPMGSASRCRRGPGPPGMGLQPITAGRSFRATATESGATQRTCGRSSSNEKCYAAGSSRRRSPVPTATH
jgi:hypothetical protein